MIEINKTYAKMQWEREKEDFPVIFGLFLGPLFAVELLYGVVGMKAWFIAVLAAAYYAAIFAHIIRENRVYDMKMREQIGAERQQIVQMIERCQPDHIAADRALLVLEAADRKVAEYETLDDKLRFYRDAGFDIYTKIVEPLTRQRRYEEEKTG